MDLAASRALAKRLLDKFGGQPGVVTRTSTAINAVDAPQTARVIVRLINREADTTEAKINAVMTHTPFEVEGCSLQVGGRDYDIIAVVQGGVNDSVTTQRVVLHGR